MVERSRDILIVSDVTEHGGVSVYLAQIVFLARNCGWHVHLLLDNGLGALRVVTFLHHLGVTAITAALRVEHQGVDAVRRTMRGVIERIRPNLIHIVLGSPRSALVPREVALQLEIPLVITEQYVAEDVEMPHDLLARLARIYEAASAVVFVSTANQRRLAERCGLVPRVGVLIHNSVSLPSSLPPRAVSSGMILTSARLSHQKGIDVLVAAAAGVRTSRARFVIAGDGPLRDELGALAATRVPGRFRFLGWREDVPALLSQADLFVLPSRAEGLPFALLEAIAAGVPCVATNVSGNPEALDDGRAGLLVPPEAPAALATAIDRCFDDPQSATQRAANAFRHAKKHFDASRNLVQLADLWTRCVEQRG